MPAAADETHPNEVDAAALVAALTRYVARRVPEGECDDVVGDILLRLVRHWAELEAAERPLAWMYTTARSAIADWYRARARERRYLNVDAEVDGDAPLGSLEAEGNALDDEYPGGELVGTELAICIEPLLATLSDADAEALRLTDLGALTQTQAAARLGLSVPGMKSRVQRARRRLRETILRCCAVEVTARGGFVAVTARSPAEGCNCDCG